MKKSLISVFSVFILVGSLSGCKSMSKKDKGTLAGAGIGAVSGYAISGGSAGGAVGGAVAGGFLGRQLAR